MARVNHVKKARKDQGKCGKCGDALPKGDAYIHWSPGFRGRKRKRCTKPGCRPRPSELTANDRLSRCYAAQEEVEDTIAQWDREDVDELRSALETAAETIREVAEEYRESAEAINETAEGSPIAEECEEKADNLEEWADAIETAGGELEEADQDCETCGGDGTEDCDACNGEGTITEGGVDVECSACADSEFDAGKLACSNDECEEGKVKASDEWADQCIATVEEAIGECPL